MSDVAHAPVDFAALAAEAVAATVKEQPRDELGRFASPEADAATGAALANAQPVVGDAPADAAEGTEGTEAPEATEGGEADGTAGPEAPATPEVATVIPDPVFPCVVVDHTGAPVEGVPNLTITFKANGKERTEPLDRVVQFASFGVYNHEREQQTKAVQAEAEAVRQEAAAIAERAALREQQLARFLSDEQYREAALAEWQAAQTPEAQARRLAEERAAFQREQELVAVRQQGEAFYANKVEPSLAMIRQALPEVTDVELAAHLQLHLSRLAVDGVVPPSRYADVERYIVQELVPWAEHVNASRTQKVTQATAAAQTKVEQAKREVAKVKQSVAKAGRPVGTAPALSTEKAPTPLSPTATVEERANAALADVMAKMRRTG